MTAKAKRFLSTDMFPMPQAFLLPSGKRVFVIHAFSISTVHFFVTSSLSLLTSFRPPTRFSLPERFQLGTQIQYLKQEQKTITDTFSFPIHVQLPTNVPITDILPKYPQILPY